MIPGFHVYHCDFLTSICVVFPDDRYSLPNCSFASSLSLPILISKVVLEGRVFSTEAARRINVQECRHCPDIFTFNLFVLPLPG